LFFKFTKTKMTFYLSFSVDVLSKSLAQHAPQCSVGVMIQ
jgi:hypothetical protein